MGWLTSILNPPLTATAYDVYNDPAAWVSHGSGGNAIGGKRPAAGISIDHHTALNCAAALACTRAIAETIATLPALVFENLPDETRRKVRGSLWWKLLHDQPNPEMDSVTFYGMQTKRLINRGNAYALIEYDESDKPLYLWPVHNSRIEPRKEPSRMLPNGMFVPGKLTYLLYAGNELKPSFELEPRYVLNVVGFDTEDGITACGVVPRAKEEISLDTAAQEFSGSVYGNGALPLGLVKHPGWIPDENKRRTFRDDINSIHRGRENWNRVGVMWEGAEWVKLGFSPEEVQSLAGRVLTAKIICQYYGVPPAIVQIFDDYKFSSVEAMLKQFVMLTIRPYAVRWERAIGQQLLTNIPEDVFLEFALEGLLRGDPLAQAQANALMRQWGVLTSNEWRRQFNWNPVDGGDKLIVPLNYTTLDRVGDAAQTSGRNATTLDGQPATSVPHFDPVAISQAIAAERIANCSIIVDRPRNNGIAAARGKPKRRTAGLAKYSCQVIDDTIRRKAHAEKTAVLRAVEKSAEGFIPWLEEFHGKFRVAISKELAIGVRGWMAAKRIEPDEAGERCQRICESLADSYIQCSRQVLLAACECQPDQLGESVAAAVAAWPPVQDVRTLVKGASRVA